MGRGMHNAQYDQSHCSQKATIIRYIYIQKKETL